MTHPHDPPLPDPRWLDPKDCPAKREHHDGKDQCLICGWRSGPYVIR